MSAGKARKWMGVTAKLVMYRRQRWDGNENGNKKSYGSKNLKQEVYLKD